MLVECGETWKLSSDLSAFRASSPFSKMYVAKTVLSALKKQDVSQFDTDTVDEDLAKQAAELLDAKELLKQHVYNEKHFYTHKGPVPQIVLFDCAGQEEFYTLHHALLASTRVVNSVFVICFDLRDLSDIAKPAVQKRAKAFIKHWVNFSKIHASSYILVGTCYDIICSSADLAYVNNNIKQMLEEVQENVDSSHDSESYLIRNTQQKLFYFPINNNVSKNPLWLNQGPLKLLKKSILRNQNTVKISFRWARLFDLLLSGTCFYCPDDHLLLELDRTDGAQYQRSCVACKKFVSALLGSDISCFSCSICKNYSICHNCYVNQLTSHNPTQAFMVPKILLKHHVCLLAARTGIVEMQPKVKTTNSSKKKVKENPIQDEKQLWKKITPAVNMFTSCGLALNLSLSDYAGSAIVTDVNWLLSLLNQLLFLKNVTSSKLTFSALLIEARKIGIENDFARFKQEGVATQDLLAFLWNHMSGSLQTDILRLESQSYSVFLDFLRCSFLLSEVKLDSANNVMYFIPSIINKSSKAITQGFEALYRMELLFLSAAFPFGLVERFICLLLSCLNGVITLNKEPLYNRTCLRFMTAQGGAYYEWFRNEDDCGFRIAAESIETAEQIFKLTKSVWGKLQHDYPLHIEVQYKLSTAIDRKADGVKFLTLQEAKAQKLSPWFQETKRAKFGFSMENIDQL